MAYLEQLAEFCNEHRVLIGERAEWQHRCDWLEHVLCVVDTSVQPYRITSAPERGTAEHAEWWERAMSECRWLQNNGHLNCVGEANLGWFFELLAREVGVSPIR